MLGRTRGPEGEEEGTSTSSESESEDDHDQDEVDGGMEQEGGQCLLCDTVIPLASFTSHLSSHHSFNFQQLRKVYNSMDQLSYIKMVNWIRVEQQRGSSSVEEMLKNMCTGNANDKTPWEDDKWLTPTLPDDPMLHFWFEDEDDNCDDENNQVGVDHLVTKVQELEIQNKMMRDAFNRVVQDESAGKSVGCGKSKSSINPVKDADYFETYDALDIHSEMLKDYPRTLAYKRAIQENAKDFEGKQVMDLGCGTGILSMFAADAGAKMVYAVDCSKMIYDAMDIVFENNREHAIKFVNKQLETVSNGELDKVDILISEFMGYFLLFEGMTQSYLYARDHFLKPDGKMFPNKATMYLVALSDEDKYSQHIEIWDAMHGYKMTALKRKLLQEALVQSVDDPGVIVSNEVVIKDLDLHSCDASDLFVEGVFDFTISRDCALTSVCGYFDVGFQDGSLYQEILSTAPNQPLTHWKQTVFYLPQKIPVCSGDKIPIKFSCNPHPEFERWLKIDLRIANCTSSYEMK